MKVLLSPTKTMKPTDEAVQSAPMFLEEAQHIVKVLQELSVDQIKDWMKVSSNIATTVFTWYQLFGKTLQPAASTYRGEAFKHLDFSLFSSAEKEYGNQSLRILSALYGYLCPLDGISRYRLDLTYPTSKVNLPSFISFYQPKVTQALMDETTEKELIINCTSHEYSQLLDMDTLKNERNFVTIHFLQRKNNQLSSISMHTKKARGIFARWAILAKPETTHDLKNFTKEGYQWFKADDHNLYFVKDL